MIRLADGVRCLALLFAFTAALALADDPSRVLPAGQKPDDMRLKPQRTLNDKFHPWAPPETKEAWEKAAERSAGSCWFPTGSGRCPKRRR